jgi:hypothetical protein
MARNLSIGPTIVLDLEVTEVSHIIHGLRAYAQNAPAAERQDIRDTLRYIERRHDQKMNPQKPGPKPRACSGSLRATPMGAPGSAAAGGTPSVQPGLRRRPLQLHLPHRHVQTRRTA